MATFKSSKQVRYDRVITLMSNTLKTKDEIGNEVWGWKEKKVPAREVQVSAAEFYNAAQAGLRPETQFETYQAHYDGAVKVKYDGTVYNIIRTRVIGDKILIVCERVAADG
jgi:SPP1 family predicted phage head-tail adaptor